MDKHLFTIGEISKMKNITTKALRFYDKIGLLKPYSVDQTNQYRYYHPDQLMHVDIIKAARNLDISPNDLIPLFKRQDSAGLVALLQDQREKALEKLKRLQNVLIGIDHIRNNLLAAESSITHETVYTREIPQRHILAKPWKEYAEPQDILSAYSALDILADELEGIATYESGVLYKICENSTLPDKLFTCIARPVKSEYYGSIPEGKYLCVHFTEENADERQTLLNDYIAAHTIKPLDIIQAELLTNLFHPKQTVWELQVRF